MLVFAVGGVVWFVTLVSIRLLDPISRAFPSEIR